MGIDISGVKKGIYYHEFGRNSRNFLAAKISSLKVHTWHPYWIWRWKARPGLFWSMLNVSSHKDPQQATKVQFWIDMLPHQHFKIKSLYGEYKGYDYASLHQWFGACTHAHLFYFHMKHMLNQPVPWGKSNLLLKGVECWQ